MSESIGKYLTVDDVGSHKAKTRTIVVNGSDNKPLGVIRWYGAWRQYTFWPNGQVETVLNATCLHDIELYVRGLTLSHMAGLASLADARSDAQEGKP